MWKSATARLYIRERSSPLYFGTPLSAQPSLCTVETHLVYGKVIVALAAIKAAFDFCGGVNNAEKWSVEWERTWNKLR